ncbi:MAG: enoyl-CoA hydratase/isomerase family protein [Ottowia sp.]|nr:enoyl-CoA hydratase/isomerase family protein [Ottowia sp.]
MKKERRILPLVTASVDGAVGELCLTRPQQRNAINDHMIEQVLSLCQWFDQHEGVKVVILRGEGAAFSAGMDIDLFRHGTAKQMAAAADLTRQMVERITMMNAVVVAAIHGSCVGVSSIMLAAACDLRYAARDTAFFLPEINLGIPVSYSGMSGLAKSLGSALTLEMALLGRPVPTERLYQKNFLNGIFEPQDLLTESRDIAAQLTRSSALVLRMTKQQMAHDIRTLASAHHSFQFISDLGAALVDPESMGIRNDYLRRLRDPDAPTRGA